MDTLANSLTIIRNGIISRKDNVQIPYSKLVSGVLSVLYKYGFIENLKVIDSDSIKKKILVTIRPNAIHEIKLISKQSCRVYTKKANIAKVKNGFGISVLSTNLGIMSAKDARLNNVGGELLMEVW